MANVTELRINGRSVAVDAEAGTSLLEVLREQAGLTGAKYGCGEGRCGACTVLVAGEAVRSCSIAVETVSEQEITTVEGLASDSGLHPVQQAFLDVEALQCGYCTPGMVMGSVALLRAIPRPSRAEIVAAMEGHICRCGTYPRIIAAIERAAQIPGTGAETSGSGAQ